ncbi:hypothetical protein AGMMS50296_8980 [Alphaproteobacteria bacterium]|nr:hypothetical protein AGMMS50296_8980 [Alphaproteobacteria bacterium]
MAYCVEFKKKVLEFWGRDKNTLRETAKVFKISTNTLNRWKREFSQTGTFQKRPVQRKL